MWYIQIERYTTIHVHAFMNISNSARNIILPYILILEVYYNDAGSYAFKYMNILYIICIQFYFTIYNLIIMIHIVNSICAL